MLAATVADHGVGPDAEPLHHRVQRVTRDERGLRSHLDAEEILLQSLPGRSAKTFRRGKHAIARPVAVLVGVQSLPEIKPLAGFRKRFENIAQHAFVLGAFTREDKCDLAAANFI